MNQWKEVEVAVGFLDILGHTEKMIGIDKDKSITAKQKSELLAREYAPIKALREIMNESLKRTTIPDSIFTSANIHSLAEIDEFKQMFRRTTSSFGFSDSFVLIAQLDPTLTYPFIGINRLIRTVASAMYAAPSINLAIRGGIELATGYGISELEVFGPPLAYAAGLEKEAKSPRVLVGPALAHRLEDERTDSRKTNDTRRTMTIDRTVELIGSDSDGKLIVDYFGMPFLQELGVLSGESNALATIRGGNEFIKTQIAKFEGNNVIREKYKYLERYFSKALWSIPAR